MLVCRVLCNESAAVVPGATIFLLKVSRASLRDTTAHPGLGSGGSTTRQVLQLITRSAQACSTVSSPWAGCYW